MICSLVKYCISVRGIYVYGKVLYGGKKPAGVHAHGEQKPSVLYGAGCQTARKAVTIRIGSGKD